jgi:peptide/nickel transport system substrate-binding protein
MRILGSTSIAVGTVAALALTAAGCSGSAGAGHSADVRLRFGAISGAMDPNVKGPAAPIPGAKKGGTLTVLNVGGTQPMDPTDSYGLVNSSVLNGMVARTLTQYYYNPKTHTQTLVPDLATNDGTHNKNYTQWTFTLKKGIKFENGQPVTPEDIKYGIERSFDRPDFPDGANYSNLYFLDGSTYTGPYGKDKGKPYNGVVIHGQSITIKMSKPFPGMPYWAAFPAMGPIPPGSASTPSKYALHPWATGPYKFAQYTPNVSLTLVKNPNWNPDTDAIRHQYFDKIVFKLNMDASQVDQILLADRGSAQTTISLNNVLAADFAQFEQKASSRLATGSVACTYFWEPDNQKITNPTVRRALAWAYPYRDAWAAQGEVPGVTLLPAANPTPPGVVGRTPFDALAGHKPAETNAAKAKALLKQAHALGYTIRWPYDTDIPQGASTSVSVKNVQVEALKAAGFNPQPVASTSSTDSSLYDNPKANINVRPIEWCPDWPTGDSFLPAMFQSTNLAKNGFGSNYSAFDQPSVDARMNAIELLPQSQQPAAWNQLERKIMSTWYPVVPLSYAGLVLPAGSDVEGFTEGGGYAPTWNTMWLK